MPEPLDHVLLGHAPLRLGRKVRREARRTRARARDDAFEHLELERIRKLEPRVLALARVLGAYLDAHGHAGGVGYAARRKGSTLRRYRPLERLCLLGGAREDVG